MRPLRAQQQLNAVSVSSAGIVHMPAYLYTNIYIICQTIPRDYIPVVRSPSPSLPSLLQKVQYDSHLYDSHLDIEHLARHPQTLPLPRNTPSVAAAVAGGNTKFPPMTSGDEYNFEKGGCYVYTWYNITGDHSK